MAPHPHNWGVNFHFHIIKRGGSGTQINAWGDLKGSSQRYLLQQEGFQLFLNNTWLWGLNFKCWSWPVLVKQRAQVVLVNSKRPTVYTALTSTSLNVKGSLQTLQQKLLNNYLFQYLLKVLHTHVTECSSGKH